jgi:ABC-type glycerol-3-phosphate transport system substrate-binding protein
MTRASGARETLHACHSGFSSKPLKSTMRLLTSAVSLLRRLRSTVWTAVALICGCQETPAGPPVVTLAGSALGAEGAVLRRQLARFMREHPDIRVQQQETPDAADQRHQLYVQWLNAHAGRPDILQLDVVWTPEFAAAGWILPLDRFAPDTAAFLPAAMAANRWRGRLYAMPWFVDVGMLYWRTDLMSRAPTTFAELATVAARARQQSGLRYGLAWQGARYEGLVAVFAEYLGGHGGRILDGSKVVVNSAAGVRALTLMREEIYREAIVPQAALTWHEEEARFAFQNGEVALMRNWPYAFALMEDTARSLVAGRFAVAPMPAAPGGTPTATLGGAQLAINAYSEHPDAAWRVIDFLTAPEQMLERGRGVGEFPARLQELHDSTLTRGMVLLPSNALAVIEHATPRPVTPVYSELSGLLQIHLHRALTGQEEPAQALDVSAAEMQAVLERSGLGVGEAGDAR